MHHPVVNKDGEVIASAVTNLDLHDLARIGCTYGVPRFYVVTPLTDQQALVERILAHWVSGFGGSYNPRRRTAMERVRTCEGLDRAVAAVARREGRTPRIVATSAQAGPRRIGFRRLRAMLADGRPTMLVFGTAWGLAEAVLAGADHVLAPIEGTDGYNHLPVRAAAAIVLDRLAGGAPS